MRYAIVLTAACAGLAAAVAIPQDIDFDAVASLTTITTGLGPPATLQSQAPTYNPSTAASAAAAGATEDPVVTDSDDDGDSDDSDSADKKRDVFGRAACKALPAGSGPTTSPDTAQAFLNNPVYSDTANNAATPQGYSLAFSNLQGATQQTGYLGFYTLTSYDTIKCQQICDKTTNCFAFNIYIERDPSVDPGSGCKNPPSTVNYKCSLYGSSVTSYTATNTGQYRSKFQVVIAGSNGYNKNAAPPSYPDFTGPTALGGAINAPDVNGQSTYIGVRVYSGPYDPSQCAAVCQATTEFDATTPAVQENGTYKPCNFFTAYVVSVNNQPTGTYCAMYTQPWDKSYATNTGQYDSSGNYYSVSQAYSYTLTVQDPGVVSSS